jgi:hypothetical protein
MKILEFIPQECMGLRDHAHGSFAIEIYKLVDKVNEPSNEELLSRL